MNIYRYIKKDIYIYICSKGGCDVFVGSKTWSVFVASKIQYVSVVCLNKTPKMLAHVVSAYSGFLVRTNGHALDPRTNEHAPGRRANEHVTTVFETF